MEKLDLTGVYQLKNGMWGYRYDFYEDGKRVWKKRSKDENGNPFKTKSQAAKARQMELSKPRKEEARSEKKEIDLPKKSSIRKTLEEIWQEYCEAGRVEKAYSTIRKQDSLWKNHISQNFGKRYMDEISVAEINDYLAELYYVEERSYGYVEGFLKMFYLIYGQAYTRDYLSMDDYNKLCKNKETKIHMPKMKIDEETDIVVFSSEEIEKLDEYFKGTNAETAYQLGRSCGLRINECYGLKWSNIDLESGTILIDRQMQYQEGLIKLVPVKTRNAKRTIYMNDKLKAYLAKEQERQKQAAEQNPFLREQNQTFISDLDGSKLSSLELVNCLPDGKIQTVNSMKFHSKNIKSKLNISFKYHYLRHTYGTNLATLNTPSHLLRNQLGHASIDVTMKYYIAMSKSGIEVLKNNLNRI